MIAILFSCQDMDSDLGPILPSPEKIVEFNNEIDRLAEFDQPEELAETEVVSQEEPERDTEDESLECYTTHYKAAPGFDEMLALDPTSDVIFPGAILKGETIPTGEYIPIIADRAPLTLSASLQNISGSPVAQIESPTLSSVREGIKTILDQEVIGATPAQLNWEIFDVYTEEQLSVAIGANYRSAVSKVSSSFNFSESKKSHKFVLKFLQVYYTIDMDLPKNPGDLFTSLPDINSLGSSSPVYVSTVTYGRMILYTIETNYTKTDIQAAFDASFASSDGNVDVDYQKIINESEIKALVIGGSGASASQTVSGPEQVYNYITEGGDYSRDSPGAPLSYKLRFLKNNAVARVVLATEYSVRQCDVAYPVYSIEMDYVKCTGCHDGDGSAGELYGSIYGRMYVRGSYVAPGTSWTPSRSNYFSLGKGATKHVDIFVTVTLDHPDYNTDYLRLSGSLDERDGGETPFGDTDPDDDFGTAERRIILKDINNSPEIYSTGKKYELDFGEVKAGFIIKRLK